jgi:hypothetical protein
MKHAAGGMEAARNHKTYQVAPEAWLSSGMEAEVYAYGPDAVLKLYAGTAGQHTRLLFPKISMKRLVKKRAKQHMSSALPIHFAND